MEIQVIENPAEPAKAVHFLKLRQSNYSLPVRTDLARELPASFVLEMNENDLRAGGAVLSFQSGTMIVEVLWVHPNYQRRGLGTELLRKTEEIAAAKKALRIVTTTFMYQSSLGFWQRQDYEIFARLPGKTTEEELIYLQKGLIP